MDYLWTAFKTLAGIFVMSLIVPLMVWGGSGSWRRAFGALRTWWLIVGGAFVVIGGLALLMVALEAIDSGPH